MDKFVIELTDDQQEAIKKGIYHEERPEDLTDDDVKFFIEIILDNM